MRRPLLVIFLTIVVNLVGFGIVIPLLPIYAERLGASPAMIGVIFASYSLTQLISSPLLGAMSDRIGRRPALLFSIAGTVLGFVVFALGNNPWVLLIGRTIDGISGGNASIARAYITDVMKPEERAKGFGMIGAAFGIGFVLGPAIGGVFSHIDYRVPIWIAATLSSISFALAWSWLPETIGRERIRSVGLHELVPLLGESFAPLAQVARRAKLRRLLVIDFLYWAGAHAYQTTLGLVAERRFGFDVPQTAYLLTGLGVLSVVIQGGLIGRIVRRLGERVTLVVALVLAASGLEIAAQVSTLWIFVAALIPAAVGAAMFMPALAALLAHGAGKQEQGAVQGAATMVEGLGRTVGPIGGSVLLQSAGDVVAYGIAAGLMGAGAVLGVLSAIPSRAEQAPAPDPIKEG
jgi:MFS transporter, DHA1 family, tetracycline resistance protein